MKFKINFKSLTLVAVSLLTLAPMDLLAEITSPNTSEPPKSDQTTHKPPETLTQKTKDLIDETKKEAIEAIEKASEAAKKALEEGKAHAGPALDKAKRVTSETLSKAKEATSKFLDKIKAATEEAIEAAKKTTGTEKETKETRPAESSNP